MNPFSDKVSFIWSVADLLRGPYKPPQYGRVILPLVVLRRLDCVLERTKDKVLAKHEAIKGTKIENVEPILNRASGVPFHNTSKLDFQKLKGEPDKIAANLTRYIKSFSSKAREILEYFGFEAEIARLDEASKRAAKGQRVLARVSANAVQSAIMRDIESFLLELGAGFTLVARQKCIIIDGEDLRLDRLFYHRRLRRLVALELKLGKFEAADKGRMEPYLRWLDKHEREAGEDSPLGLILCERAGGGQVELLELDKSSIRVATYLTELPPKALLEQKLHAAAELARKRVRETAG